MGRDVHGGEWSHEERQRYREKVRQNLDVFARLLADASFEADEPSTGMELELYLVDADMHPSFTNTEVLEAIDHDAYQTELAKYNIELNVNPRVLSGEMALQLESDVIQCLNDGQIRALSTGAQLVYIGILPTLMPEHLAGDWMSENLRYAALNDAIMRQRGENMRIDIQGMSGERLAMYIDSIAPESACTSLQLHLQVAPQRFPACWNAAQAIAGPQIAVAANSPFFCGKALWHETRIPLFMQSIDTRSEELAVQGVRPRVFFGERWITSIFDLFEENVRYYPSLLPEVGDEDPIAVLDEGGAPELDELRLHNGTVYRWNRPIYDTRGGKPHLRVENRILPAGPTVCDVMANAMLYYGIVAKLSEEERPLWTRMSFETAEANFNACARDGLNARIYWPGYRSVTPDELVLRELLPKADEGLASWGVSGPVRDRFLSVIEGRCSTRQNGATWQLDCVDRLEAKGEDRRSALTGMLRRYIEHMQAGEPVHSWPLPD